MFRCLPILLALALPTTAHAVRVRLDTSAGPIVVELATTAAPITTRNFLAYVDGRRFDGMSFYRAARNRQVPGHGFIQGGIQQRYKLMLPAIAHEPTSRTGLKHEAGVISMARSAPGTAMGNFFITASPLPSMDANPKREGDNLGYAVFGRVVSGMDVVRRILAMPVIPNAGRGAMRGQMIARPVTIRTARRL